MRFSVFVIALFVAPLLMAHDGGCGESRGVKDLGETCTRNEDCARDLVCTGGTCREESDGAVHDSGASDASLSDATAHD